MISINEKQISTLFEEQAAAAPDRIALQSEDCCITYGELSRKSDSIANMLKDAGHLEGDTVAIQYKASLELAATVLGVIKAGGACFVSDFKLPAQQSVDILEHSGARFLLVFSNLSKDIAFKGKVINLEEMRSLEGNRVIGLESVDSSRPMFVSYNLNPYGKPEGIVLSQENIKQWLKFNIENLNVDFSDTLFIASPNLEATFPVWLASLVTGGKVYFNYQKSQEDYSELIKLMQNSGFKSVILPLFILNSLALNREFEKVFHSGIHNIITVGEDTFDTRDFKCFIKEKKIRWHNYFGFPEIQIITTLTEDSTVDTLSFKHCGKPVIGTGAYVLSPSGHPVSIGIMGELHACGSGVMYGYNRDNQLNNTRFTEHSFLPGVSLYKSGYNAKWLSDGKISFEEKSEYVINFNGCRVYPQLIENCLINNGLVDDCAAILRKMKDEMSTLTLFIVPKDEVSIGEINSCLKNNFPEEILPIGLIVLSALPYNEEGKIDRVYLGKTGYMDSLHIKSLESAIEKEPVIEHVAVLAEEKFKKPVPLYVKDFLPAPGTDRFDDSQNSEKSSYVISHEKDDKVPLSIIVGNEVKVGEGEPKDLIEALERAATLSPDNGIRYIQPNGMDKFQNYPALLEEAERVLTGLKKIGLKPKDKAILQFDNNEDYISAFWGCTLGGIIPVPVNVPKSFKEANNETNTLYNIWNTLDEPVILTSAALEEQLGRLTGYFSFDKDKIISINELKENEPDKLRHRPSPEDTAIILFTSGSTGVPKGVVQCHRSILARERGTAQLNHFTAGDISINWMPLEHVGGVVMFHLKDVYLGCSQIQVRTDYVLTNPLRWLDLISKYKATITWAPNFAFAVVNEKLEQTGAGSWDLSSMRFILNGGEAINAKTAKKFLKLLKPYGLPDTAMHPSWGMSETCSGVVYSERLTSDTDSGIHVLNKFSLNGFVKKADSDEDSITFVELGSTIPGVPLVSVPQVSEAFDCRSI